MPTVTIPLAGQYGLIADRPPQELPSNAWTRVENMRFRNNSAERVEGHIGIFAAPSVTPYWVGSFGTSTKRFWVHAGLAKVFADDGTTRTEITGTAPTGAIDDRWSGGVLSGLLILNNGVDVPQYWAGTSTLAAVTNWPAGWTAKSVRTFKNYVVYLAPTKSGTASPHTVGWSAAADPGTLPTTYDTTSTTTDAGDVPLGETPDVLVDCLPFGEVNIIYKEQSMYRMEYIGGQQVFAFKRIPGNFGMLARGCAAATPKGHVVLANGDVVLVDGVNEPQSLLDGRLKRWLFETQIDSTVYKRCFVVANPTKSEVLICYPAYGQTSCTRALVWNWKDNTMGRRDLPNVTYAASGMLDYSQGNKWSDYGGVSWSDLTKAWNANDYTPADARLIMASTLPRLYLADTRATFDGAMVNGMLERTGLAFDAPNQVKTIRAIYPRFKATSGTVVYIQVGSSMDAEVAPSWSDPVPYTVGQTFKADTFSSGGRLLAVRMYSTGKQPWACASYDVDYVANGGY